MKKCDNRNALLKKTTKPYEDHPIWSSVQGSTIQVIRSTPMKLSQTTEDDMSDVECILTIKKLMHLRY